jgi:midasin
VWERNVPKSLSLVGELMPLQERLLSWRKLEVHCWSDILNAIGNQLQQNALLTAFPLFEAYMRKLTDEDAEKYDKNLLAMTLDWLNNSSLFDLQSRLEACRLLSVLLKLTDSRVHLIPKIGAICQYFAQFLTRTDSRIKEERADAEEKLKNLVQVARYTDLNIWSVKESAQRVHSQLCRIIHQYKVTLLKVASK